MILRRISKCLLSFLMAGAGVMHFINPSFFLKIVPPYLPFHLEVVYLSGVCELALGVLLLIPKFSRWAAWGIVALLIAVFPANIYVYQHQEIVPASPTTAATRSRQPLDSADGPTYRSISPAPEVRRLVPRTSGAATDR